MCLCVNSPVNSISQSALRWVYLLGNNFCFCGRINIFFIFIFVIGYLENVEDLTEVHPSNLITLMLMIRAILLVRVLKYLYLLKTILISSSELILVQWVLFDNFNIFVFPFHLLVRSKYTTHQNFLALFYSLYLKSRIQWYKNMVSIWMKSYCVNIFVSKYECRYLFITYSLLNHYHFFTLFLFFFCFCLISPQSCCKPSSFILRKISELSYQFSVAQWLRIDSWRVGSWCRIPQQIFN